MLSAWLMLILSGSFFTLRLSGGGSFPRPLKPEEEQEYLERMSAGDMEARNKLIEHNLRLVAHIIKKMYRKRQMCCGKERLKQFAPAANGDQGRFVFRCFLHTQSHGQELHRPLLRECHL